MSFRNMSTMSSIMLLAMALAATSAHARLDLFGQSSLGSNYRGEKIPYLVCIRTCSYCVCDRRAPQFAECYCQERIPAEPVDDSEEVQVLLKEKSNEVDESIRRMPYLECMKKCDDCTACTYKLPIEANTCTCVKNGKNQVASPLSELTVV